MLKPFYSPGNTFPLFLAVIELELVGVACDLDSIAVRIEKGDGAVARDFQNFRTADDGNFSPFENRIKIVDFLVRSHVNTEVVQLGDAIAAHVLRPSRQLHQCNVMMLPPEAHESHLRAAISG